MRFKAKAMTDAEFEAWVASAKASGKSLDQKAYAVLNQKDVAPQPIYFADVTPMMFNKVLNGCAAGGICKDDAYNMALMKKLAPNAEDCDDPQLADATRQTTRARLLGNVALKGSNTPAS
jgi:cytochrome o ubiquinol oxidase subunit 2